MKCEVGEPGTIVMDEHTQGEVAMDIFVGLDIAARSVDMVWRADNKNHAVEQFEQSPEGHDRLRG